jgi:O-antigen ligase
MSPHLAACVYGAFIFFLFRRYSKEAGPMPWSLWVPFIWVCINSTRPLGYWLSSGTDAAAVSDVAGGSFYDRNVYLLLMICGIFILSRRRIEWGQIIRNCHWLLVLFAYYLFSTLWSVDTFVAFKRWVKASGDIIMILILLTETDPAEALRAVFVRSYYLLVPLSILTIKYFRDIGRYYGKWEYETHYCGLTLSKNNLGQLAMLGGLFLLWQMVDIYKRRGHKLKLRTLWPDLTVLGMCLWLLYMAQSSTALVCFVIGTAIFFGARLAWVKTNLYNLRWCVLALGLFMVVFSVSTEFRGALAGLVGRNATLTDRTLIWDMLLKSGSNPIIGEGFESFWLTNKGNDVFDEFHVTYAHNGYLDDYLDTGLVGVLLFAGMLYAAGRNVTSHFAGGSHLGYLFLSLFWSCLLFNYTEIAFGRSNVFGMLMILMVVFGPFVPVRQETEAMEEPDQPEGANPQVFAGFGN